jgi:peptidoglycan/LPS O-acetylase OafA/YrhL
LLQTFGNALHNQLARITSSNRFIPEIDGLRFVAIAAVVFYHINGYVAQNCALGITSSHDLLARFCAQGNFGVMLFFAISGFVVSLPFARSYLAQDHRVILKDYYLRRITRIEPPYLICLLVHFVLLVTVKHIPWQYLLPHLGASAIYLHYFIYGKPSTICFVAWSLEIEIQYYILAPLLAKVFAIKSKPFRRFTLVLCILTLAAVSSVSRPELTLPHYLHYFITGFLLADIFVLDWSTPSKVKYLWDTIGLTAWIVLGAILLNYWYVSLIAPWCILLAYAAAFRGHIMNAIFSQSILVTIGGMCYTIYLYHMLIVSALGRFTTLLGWGSTYFQVLVIQLAILFPAIVIVSAAIFVVAERPFMRKDILLHTIRRLRV